MLWKLIRNFRYNQVILKLWLARKKHIRCRDCRGLRDSSNQEIFEISWKKCQSLVVKNWKRGEKWTCEQRHGGGKQKVPPTLTGYRCDILLSPAFPCHAWCHGTWLCHESHPLSIPHTMFHPAANRFGFWPCLLTLTPALPWLPHETLPHETVSSFCCCCCHHDHLGFP